MENPNGELNPNFTLADGVHSTLAIGGLILGNKCGRPSENLVLMEDCSVLERPGSPIDADLQPTSNKYRNFEEQLEALMQTKPLTIDEVSVVTTQGGTKNVGSRRRASAESRDPMKVGIRIGKDLRKIGSSGSEV
ncbi:hypothetical protein V6N13_148877 [Hibiscus sabdariffa]